MAKLELIMAILVSIMLLVNIVAIVAIANKPAPEPKIVEVTKEVLVQVPVASNITDTNSDIVTIKTEIMKDDVWEADAIKLAEAENTNKHLYNAMVDPAILNITDLDDKDDIYKVVVKDSEVNDADADDKDAEVVQEVRVYYENSEGDNVRVTLEITTTIVDNEVEDVEYDFA